jgi:GAF domain-containing protein/anti-sigma regulatory factor (Ser/Thr protein kinase)
MSASQNEREKLVGAIALRIRQSLDLQTILNQTVEEVRQFLEANRVLVYRFEPDWSGLIVAESVIVPWKTVFGTKIQDHCFQERYIELYRRGRIQVVNNVETAGLTPCHAELLEKLAVKANLVVSIMVGEKLWGLLITQHCQSPRPWQTEEIELLQQLANQVGIAVQQAELYEQVQSVNIYLERKVKERTANLKQALQFEALIRRIIEKTRDSLDEKQILQTVTQELGNYLNIERCKIELYNAQQTTGTIRYEYSKLGLNSQGITRQVVDFPEIYHQLLQKQSLQFTELISQLNPCQSLVTRLGCPIYDNQGILGNLWLLRPKEESFNRLEVRVVEQVANQCAIAIRQARLYEIAQDQVKSLERLNTLKDDFLKTISHELKTPMSSILAASQTLEKLVETKGIRAIKSSQFQRVFQIFKTACQKQSKLVSDLLTLCYVDAENTPLTPEWIDLQVLIPLWVKPFQEQIEHHQQRLTMNLPASLSLIQSDIALLERIVNELLTNACKYTPSQGEIIITATEMDQKVTLSISNSGVEIPLQEQELIFDKFYRIPSHDPWQYGGTGIGLALVKKLVSLLGAKIQVHSQAAQTTFTLTF